MTGKKKQLLIGAVVLVIVCAVYIALMLLPKSKPDTVGGGISPTGTTIFTMDIAKISAVTINTSDGAITFLRSGDGWSKEGDEAFKVNVKVLEVYLATFNEMRSKTDIADCDDMAQYGLSAEKKWVTFKLDDGSTMDASIGNYNELTESYYLMTSQSSIVHVVPADGLQLKDVSLDYFKAAEETEAAGGTGSDGAETGSEEVTETDGEAGGGDASGGE